jgi:hypothetical protein
MFHNMCHKVLPASRSSIPPQPQKEISSAIIPFGLLLLDETLPQTNLTVFL